MEGKTKDAKHKLATAKKTKRSTSSTTTSQDGASVAVRVEKVPRRRTSTTRKQGAKPGDDNNVPNHRSKPRVTTGTQPVEDAVPAKPQLREHPAITKARAEGRVTPATDAKLAAYAEHEAKYYNPHGQFDPESEYTTRPTWWQIECVLLVIALLASGIVAIITSEAAGWFIFAGYMLGRLTHLHRSYCDEG